jgi:hypothetical protein
MAEFRRMLPHHYLALPLQQPVNVRILERLLPHRFLVTGTHENLPPGSGLAPLDHAPQILQRGADATLRLVAAPDPGRD